jgi:hypothetical protein
MKHEVTEEVMAIGGLNIEGNIIPLEWFQSLKLSNGKPDTNAVIILSDIVYWYRPTTVRNEQSGRIIGYKKKFKSDLLQRGYKEYEELFGLSSKQSREAIIRLENLGLIKRVFRTIISGGTKYSNVMFIQIFPKKIKAITNQFTEGGYLHKRKEVFTSVEGGGSIEVNTYTDTTTNTITKSLSVASQKTYFRSPESDLREKEMVQIWDEIIRKNAFPLTKLTSQRKKILSNKLSSTFENSMDLWREYCNKILSSKFLMGEVTDFKASLDWSLREDIITRINEGEYGVCVENNHKSNNSGQETPSQIMAAEATRIKQEIESSKENESIKAIRQELLESFGVSTYKSWFTKIELLSITHGLLEIKATSKFIGDYIQTHYLSKIEGICMSKIQNLQKIKVVI